MKQWFSKFVGWFKRKPRQTNLFSDWNPTQEATPHQPWWGKIAFQPNETRHWQINQLQLQIEHRAHGWRLTHSLSSQPTHIKEWVLASREELVLLPALSTLFLVTHLPQECIISPGETRFLYIAFPVNLQITTIEPLHNLCQFPTAHLNETWIGLDTLQGELGQAVSAQLYFNHEDIPRDFGQAITCVSIHNQHERFLQLSQLTLPLPYLSLYQDVDKTLWTEQLSIHWQGEALPEVTIAKGAPRTIYSGALLVPAHLQTLSRTGFKQFLQHLIGK